MAWTFFADETIFSHGPGGRLRLRPRKEVRAANSRGSGRRAAGMALLFALTSPIAPSAGQAAADRSTSPPAAAEITNSIGMKLVLIPAGEFMMGSSEPAGRIVEAFPLHDVAPGDFADEFPRHRVRVTRAFYFGKHEVTNAQFRRFIEEARYLTQAEREERGPRGSGGWGFNLQEQEFEGRNRAYNWRNPGFAVQDDAPVVNITWHDAVAFCEWLSRKEGRKYRLPTEAEWEYAARAGTTTRYWPGDDPELLARVANTADATYCRMFPRYYGPGRCLNASDGQALPATVGTYPPNAFGLHDMHGNVWEWTSDWYAKDYYAHSPTDDPRGPEDGGEKVRRGGAWHTVALWTRASFRNYNTVDSRYPNLGLRVVLPVVE